MNQGLHILANKKQEILDNITSLQDIVSSEIFSKNVSNEICLNYLERLKDLKTRLNDNVFRILVLGEFSAGKSTFLNAILGRRILPTATTETTAAINVIKFGEIDQIEVQFLGSGGRITIPNDELLKYSTSLTSVSDETARTVDTVFITTPSDYCKNGVEFIDTPGLNTVYEFHEKRTLEFLKNGNAAIMILDGTQFLTHSEIQYLDTFRQYLGKIFFVVNRVNQMPEDDSFYDNYDNFIKKINKRFETESIQELFPVDAFLGEKGDLTNSGIQTFLDKLSSFLTSDEKFYEKLNPIVLQARSLALEIVKNLNQIMGLYKLDESSYDIKQSELSDQIPKTIQLQKQFVRYATDRSSQAVEGFDIFSDECVEEKLNYIQNSFSNLGNGFGLDKIFKGLNVSREMVDMINSFDEYCKNEIENILDDFEYQFRILIQEHELDDFLFQNRDEIDSNSSTALVATNQNAIVSFQSNSSSSEEHRMDLSQKFATAYQLVGGGSLALEVIENVFTYFNNKSVKNDFLNFFSGGSIYEQSRQTAVDNVVRKMRSEIRSQVPRLKKRFKDQIAECQKLYSNRLSLIIVNIQSTIETLAHNKNLEVETKKMKQSEISNIINQIQSNISSLNPVSSNVDD